MHLSRNSQSVPDLYDEFLHLLSDVVVVPDHLGKACLPFLNVQRLQGQSHGGFNGLVLVLRGSKNGLLKLKTPTSVPLSIQSNFNASTCQIDGQGSIEMCYLKACLINTARQKETLTSKQRKGQKASSWIHAKHFSLIKEHKSNSRNVFLLRKKGKLSGHYFA